METIRNSIFGTDAGVALSLLNSEYEQYKVPSNWCWTNIGSITTMYRGVSYKKNDEHHEKKINDCLVMRGGNVEEGRINLENDNVYVDRTLVTDKQLVKENDIIIVTSTGSTRVIGRAGISFSDYSDVTFGAFLTLVRPSESVNKRYVAYYFQSEVYRNRIRQLACGVNINNIKNEYITETPIPLAPLAEQQRIVEKIETLFSKLNKAKEKAREVLDNFENQKASMLHKAFAGELTAKWRKKNNISNNSWKNESIEELCHSLNYGTSKKSKPEGSVVVIRMGNLQQGEIDWTDLAYTEDQEDIKKYKLFPDDVLFNRTNSAALVGKTAIYRGDYPAIFAGYLIKLDYDHNLVLGDYLNYALNTTTAKEYCNRVKTDGVNQSNINAKKIGAFVIPVASIAEQKEIVRIVGSFFEKELQTKQTAEAVIEKIDMIKKSILARAFRGELGTNDSNDESAAELLKEILSDKALEKEKQPKIKQKRISIPKEIEAQITTGLEKKIIKLLLESKTKEVSVKNIMSVSSKTFDILDAIRTLENKQLIKESRNKHYKLLR
jgi:type I restriction enzyme S subunit